MSWVERLQNWERRKRAADRERVFADFSIAAAERHVWQYDHGFLRRFWTNLDEIAPGVFRSNYPSARRFPKLKSLGIRHIISLRGEAHAVTYKLEETLCSDFGIGFHSINLNARGAPLPQELLRLLDLFEHLEKPFLMHCKSGADRAGLASALYLFHCEDVPLSEARKMLSLRYLHLNDRKTGIMGYFLTTYGAATAETGISMRDWIATEYDAKKLLADFKNSRKK